MYLGVAHTSDRAKAVFLNGWL